MKWDLSGSWLPGWLHTSAPMTFPWPFMTKIGASPLKLWAKISPSPLEVAFCQSILHTAEKSSRAWPSLSNSWKTTFRVVLLLSITYGCDVLNRCPWGWFSSGANSLWWPSSCWCSTLLLHPFVDPSADDIVHGALLKGERFVRCDCCQVKPALLSFCRTSLNSGHRDKWVASWVVVQKIR